MALLRHRLKVISMSPHVPVEISRLGETCFTYFTLVGLFTSVRSVVLGERGAVCKSLSTHVTFVGAFTRVRAHVRGDGGALREAAITYGTFERLFSAVRP